MNEEKKLTGKKALVTGGSRGLGSAIARGLAAAGADVAITYAANGDKAQAVVEDLRAVGVRAAAFQSDQGDPAQAATLIEKVTAELGGLDILINNAAISVAGHAVDNPEADVATLDRMWAVNVHGVVANIRAAAPVLSAGGRIVTIGSGVASRVGFPTLADYAGTKAAVVGYSKGAARDLGPRDITVNVVQAGLMDTDMSADAGVAENFFPMLAIQRYGRVEEVAAAAVFLASPEASYITGAVLDAEGGYMA